MSTEITWSCKNFHQLDNEELYQALKLRSKVFVVEQDCVYEDLDDMDQQAYHLVGYQDGRLLCYARLFEPGIKYPAASIGRVISSNEVRGKGYGKLLMLEAIRSCSNLWPDTAVSISAQQHLENFYQSIGFETVSEPYMEDGIPHIEMCKSANAE